MYLSNIHVQNFRSFEELCVELQPGLNVLVGRNNTGKTNLLQAIRHALGPGASRGDALWLERDHFYRRSATDTDERVISITLTFSGLTEEQRAYFYEIVDFDVANISNSKAIIRFEASWPKSKRQASIKRTGGPASPEATEVPTKLLESMPITFLPALRNAEESLAPGYRNRLASLLLDLIRRQTEQGQTTERDIKDIFLQANLQLEAHKLIEKTKSSLQTTTKDIAGTDHSPSSIKAAGVEFERILRTLHLQMEASPIGSLSANGLGYNNLLYIAVVLEHLKSPDADEFPLFLVEEPEAHLHPQLTMLLADFLANKTPGAKVPQTIVTTHSPTLAANVPPDRVCLLFSSQSDGKTICSSLQKAGMDEKERTELQRMMDVTRATLYFAKGVILVEGISEAVLVPMLATRLGYDLAKLHISVVPICGVAFGTFQKLFEPTVLGLPVSIVTDGDPPVARGESWSSDTPVAEGGSFKMSPRTANLIDSFSQHTNVKVFRSKVTLEYDLAEAGEANAATMASVWEECFTGNPGTFNLTKVSECASLTDKALAAWRGICRADHTGSKAEFAQRLATALGQKQENSTEWKHEFSAPDYLRQAIAHVAAACSPPSATDGTPQG